MLDLLITGGAIVDGTGAPTRYTDVGIRDGRIAILGPTHEPATRVISAWGKTIAPGFVDIHTHYDAQLDWDPAGTPSALHGVTTVIGGNCGFGLAPLRDDDHGYLMRLMARVEGIPLESLQHGLDWSWRSFGTWLDRFDARLSVNAGFLAGHSPIRRQAMGDAAFTRQASPEEISVMKRLLAEALEAGAMGFSTSLGEEHFDWEGRPVPSRWATHSEIVDLCSVVKQSHATTIQLNPTVLGMTPGVSRLMSAMSLASNRPVNWNVMFVDSDDRRKVETQLHPSDIAAQDGGRVVALVFPEVQRSRLSFLDPFIWSRIRGWEHWASLSLGERLSGFSDRNVRSALRDAAHNAATFYGGPPDWGSMLILDTYSPKNKELEGLSISEIAGRYGVDPFDALLDIVVADAGRTGFMRRTPRISEEVWKLRAEVWCDPRTIVGGSDAGAHLDNTCGATYTTSLLADGVRKHGALSLEEAIHQLSDVPARLYGLRGRGRVQEGWWADLVIFDPKKIAPRNSHMQWDLPQGAGRLFSEALGLDHVFVNGVEVVAGGQLLDVRPGQLIRSGRDTEPVRCQ